MKLELVFEKILGRPPTSVFLSRNKIYVSSKSNKLTTMDYDGINVHQITVPTTILSVLGDEENVFFCSESKYVYVLIQGEFRKITNEKGPFTAGCVDTSRKHFYIAQSSKKILVFDRNCNFTTAFYGPDTQITNMAISAKNMLAVISHLDCTVRIFGIEKQPINITLEHVPKAVKFLGNYKLVVGTDVGLILVYGLKSNKVIASHKLSDRILSIDNIDNFILVGTDTGKIVVLNYVNSVLEETRVINVGGLVVSIQRKEDYVVAATSREPRLDRSIVSRKTKNKLVCFTIIE